MFINWIQVSGVPYAISAVTTTFVYVTSSAHVEELGKVPEGKPSLVVLAEDYRALWTLLTANLPTLHLGLQQKISATFDAELLSSSKTADDWSKVPNDPVILDAVLQYPEGIFKTGEALRSVPEILAPYIVKSKRKCTNLALVGAIVS
ncbi:hypothetical protein BDR22DRAFT_819360 [Usnea florida]